MVFPITVQSFTRARSLYVANAVLPDNFQDKMIYIYIDQAFSVPRSKFDKITIATLP